MYADIDNVRRVLKPKIFQYPADIDADLSFAETIINSHLAGFYLLPFDDVTNYASVPVEINWIASLLAASMLWDGAVALEGQTDDTASGRWYKKAMNWLDCLRDGKCSLTLVDGSVVIPQNTISGPRSYPSGVRDKAPSEDNIPQFTREQIGKW